ncbi:MAG: cysteine hydrolase [Syntrophaceae bacterium]|nr:cysteine hydrolase [Syntrophaceae bacterium]
MQRIALLIIDMQNDFVLPGSPGYIPGAERIVDSVARLSSFVRERKGLVVHVIRTYRPDGSDVEAFRLPAFQAGGKLVVQGTRGAKIIEKLTPTENEPVVFKKRFSGFMNTELDLLLRRRGITGVVVCGLQYPNCVRATVLDAVSLDYTVTLITDATAGETRAVCEANILDMKNIGVLCVTLKEFRERWKKQTKKSHDADRTSHASPTRRKA